MRSRVWLFILFTVSLLAFQNCSRVNFNPTLVKNFESLKGNPTSDGGNGEPYDGKPDTHYYQVSPGFSCEGKPNPVAILSQKATGEFSYTYNQNDKCGIVPNIIVDQSQLDLASYDPSFVGFRDGIFAKGITSATGGDAPPSDQYPEAWCRPQTEGLSSPYDVVIQKNVSSTTLTAQIFYRDNSIVKKVDPFPISKASNGDLLTYTTAAFKLAIDRKEPSPEAWWYYPAVFDAQIDQKPVHLELNCRVAAEKLLGVLAKSYPQNGSWNSYVKYSNKQKDLSHQDDVSCVGTEPLLSDCLHGAERMSVSTGLSSCKEISISEDLGAFIWSCQETANGAQIVSRGLKSGKGLGDLLDANGWRKNRLTIKDRGITRYETLPAAWWGNPVLPLPDNSTTGATVSLTGPGNVFVLSATRESAGYKLADDKQSLVVLPGSELKVAANVPVNCDGIESLPFQKCLVTSVGHKFLRLEGSFADDYHVASGLLAFDQVDNLVLNNVNTHGAFKMGIHFDYVNKAQILNASSQNNMYGLYANASQHNLIFAGEFFANSNSGLNLGNQSNDIGLVNVSSHDNNFAGLNASATDRMIISHSSFAKNSSTGVYTQQPGGLYQKFNSVLSRQNNLGFNFQSTQFGLFSDLASVENLSLDYQIVTPVNVADASSHKFINDLITGSAVTCRTVRPMGPTNMGLIDNTCTDSGAEGSSTYSGQLSSASLRKNCVWDVPNDKLVCVNYSRTPSALQARQACPTDASGDQVIQDNLDPSHYYLRFAIEVPGFENGNNNGLCESNETCLYAPEFLVPSGRGPGYSDPCIFQDGLVKGVSLY